MPRNPYDVLTDATQAVLDGNVKAVALGWDKCKQYVYEMANGDRKDPFAYFVSMYQGTLAGGVSTGPWDAELAALRAKYAADFEREDVSIQELNKEWFDVLDALLAGKSADEVATELRELIEVAQLKLAGVEKLQLRMVR